MSFINKYLRNFTPYKTASHKVWNVPSEEREKILKLDWNEATIAPSPEVIKRIETLVKGPQFYNLYPATTNDELIRLLSEYTHLPKENVQYFASSDSLHEYIAKLYITVGDPILIVGPSYDNFRLTAEVCGAKIFYYNIGDSFEFDARGFLEKIDEICPSMVYICNPNNPTGTTHKTDFINELLLRYPQILFLIDEAYAEFAGSSAKELVLKHENILISRTMSKAFALANFRFGYLIASRDNISYISNIRNSKNITTFAQEAAIGALSDIAYMEKYVEEVNKAAVQFVTDLSHLSEFVDCIRGEGNFVLLRLKRESDKNALIDYLNCRNIFVRNVSQTELLKKYCIRVTIGTCSQMKYVAQVIGGYFEEHR